MIVVVSSCIMFMPSIMEQDQLVQILKGGTYIKTQTTQWPHCLLFSLWKKSVLKEWPFYSSANNTGYKMVPNSVRTDFGLRTNAPKTDQCTLPQHSELSQHPTEKLMLQIMVHLSYLSDLAASNIFVSRSWKRLETLAFPLWQPF